MHRLSSLSCAALLLAGIGCGSPRSTRQDPCPAEAPSIAPGEAHALKTVFVVVLENQDWSAIAGNPAAPYINATLLPRFAHAVNYRNGGVHPSLPNYVTFEAGDPLGVRFDAVPTELPLPVACHLATYLEATGISWKAYAEDIPGGACPIGDVGGYVVRHDPFVYFEDVSGSPPGPASARCIEHVRPHAELAQDLQSGAMPRYVFVIPNVCDSGHDSCAPLHDRVAQADAFLARELPLLMASHAYQDGGVVLVTWDEGAAGDQPIGLIAVSPLAKPGHAGAIPYSHASTLRTVQEIFSLRPFLRGAATATSLADLFTAYP